MNFQRASFLVYTGAGILAAGTVFAWRSLFRFLGAVASAKQPALPQSPNNACNEACADAVTEKKLSGKRTKSTMTAPDFVRRGVVAHKDDAVSPPLLCKALHPGHPAPHDFKRSTVVTHLAPTRTHRNELSLPTALEQALHRKIKVDASARCRQQQASAIKNSMSKNRQQLGHAKKAPKSYADNGRKASRNQAH